MPSVWVFTLPPLMALVCVGNGLVALSFARRPFGRDVLLTSLALGDMMVGWLVLPPAFTVGLWHRWQFGVIGCRLWLSAELFLSTMLSSELVAVGIHLSRSLRHPVNIAATKLDRSAVQLLAVSIGVAVVLAIPLAIVADPDEFCRPDRIVSLCDAIGNFLLPGCIAAAISLYTIVATSRRSNQVAKKSKFLQAACRPSVNIVDVVTAQRRWTEPDVSGHLERSRLLTRGIEADLLPCATQLRRLEGRVVRLQQRECRAARLFGLLTIVTLALGTPMAVAQMIQPRPPGPEDFTFACRYLQSAVRPLLVGLFHRRMFTRRPESSVAPQASKDTSSGDL